MGTSIRQLIDQRHETLRSRVVAMGSHAGEMTRLAVEATISEDFALAEKVIAMDDFIDGEEYAITRETVAAFALEAPVARDLKFLTATLGVVVELEKAGDHAVKLARRVRKLQGAFPAELKLALSKMSEESRRLLACSVRLYVDFDPVLAAEIRTSDEVVDSQYSAARRVVLSLIEENPSDARQLMRSLAVCHAVEHIADTAVEIAHRLKMHYVEGR